MNPQQPVTRRTVLKTAALGTLSLPLLGSLAFAADEKAKKKKAGKAAEETVPEPANPSSPDGRENGLRLGIASYSVRNMTLDEAIAVVKVLRIRNTALFKNHCNWETASVEECKGVGEKLKAVGLNLTGSGVINLPNDEAKCRKAFENVKAAGMQTMVCKPAKDALPLVEKLTKEFDQKLAIHNHGPEDKEYPTPDVIWNAIRSLDKRIGLCIDVGHTARGGADPIAAIKLYATRLYDVHMKDSVAIVGAQRDVPIEVGAGRLDVIGILRTLLEIKYDGVVSFEYEKVAGNPVTGLAESLGYVRGVLAGLAKK
jgi:sugar phosphate isomerase/epimerase